MIDSLQHSLNKVVDKVVDADKVVDKKEDNVEKVEVKSGADNDENKKENNVDKVGDKQEVSDEAGETDLRSRQGLGLLVLGDKVGDKEADK